MNHVGNEGIYNRQFIEIPRQSKYLWHRLTKTDLQGAGAVDYHTLKHHLKLKGFDLTRPWDTLKDIDSIYFRQTRA
jgi:hypothetical protein